jgi:iron complex outermembrane receptor protein
MKTLIQVVISFLLLCQPAFSQNIEDTVKINTVEVIETFIPETYKTTKFDSIKKEQSSNLSELINNNSGVFIKSYGAGSLASISFRGTGASHTQVLWNGVALNSPMNGQIDFSLYPTLFFDEAELHHGASGLIDGTGALGGSVILNNTEQYNNQTKIDFKQTIGSFNNYSSAIKLKLGNDNWFYETQVYGKSDKNNFEYKNISVKDAPIEELERAGNKQYGLQQAIYHKLKNGSFGGRVWYFNSDRELPGLITQTNSNEESQKDESIRALIELKGLKNNFQYHISTALINEMLNYKNVITETNSKSKSYLFNSNINTTKYIANQFKVINNIIFKHEVANTDGYSKNQERTTSSWLLGINKDFKKLSLNAFNRIVIIEKELKPFAPGFGIQYRLFNKEALLIKANAGTNYHYPTFNDLYWSLGGNESLKPEKSEMLESGISYSKTLKNFELNTEITAFYSKVEDWIIWLPTEFSYWSPTNLKDVVNKGFESSLSISTRIKKIKINGSSNYAYTKSTNLTAKNQFDNSIDKQLIYVPFHKLNSSLLINFKSINLIYTYNYTGKRFITTDNDTFLPANFISDISISNQFKINQKVNILTTFKVNNILGQDFQSMAWRPMPGRNYLITLTFKFNS